MMADHRGRLLMAALGFAGLPRPSYDRALWARGWLFLVIVMSLGCTAPVGRPSGAPLGAVIGVVASDRVGGAVAVTTERGKQ